jgi:AmiR/NasT family two-component response regulator
MYQNQKIDVLIAEDDALINEGVAEQLTRLGYPAAGQAFDGVEAVEMTVQKRPAVVLMDLQMIDPETGREDIQAGLRAARAIQQRCPTPVVVLSAHESPELIRQSAEAGVSAYLVKPAGDRDLDRTLTIARARFDDLLESRARANELGRQKEEMQDDLKRRRTLAGLLSICAYCHKIRDEEGHWKKFETYIEERSDVAFAHGICPECWTQVIP